MNILALLACITITQQPQPSVVYGVSLAEYVTRVEATAPSAITYQWYEGGKGDTSRPIRGSTASAFCTDRQPGPYPCSWGGPQWSLAVWVRLTASCGTADSEMTTVTMKSRYGDFTWVYMAYTNRPLRPLHAADFSGDGHPDLLMFSEQSRELRIWTLAAYAPVALNESLDRLRSWSWVPAAAADMDGDGDSDLILQTTAGHPDWRVMVWLLEGRHVVSTEELIGIAQPGWRVAGAADFDHDNDADLLLINEATRENVIWTMDRLKLVDTEHFLPQRAVDWHVAGVGDFDGDGWSDILLRAGSLTNPGGLIGPIAVWRMQGMDVVDTEYFPVSQVSFSEWTRISTVGDFDHDGDVDILTNRDFVEVSPLTMQHVLIENLAFP